MKYYYIYSDGYEFWDERLKTELAPHFIPVGLKINPVTKNKKSNHFHAFASTKNTVKIDLVCDCIKSNMNDFIIFSDANFCVNNKLVKEYKKFMDENKSKDLDIIFANNKSGKHRNSEGHKYNIGLMLIKCNQKTLNFFKNVSHQISENKYDGWDQTVVNQLLLEQDALTDIPITHSMFEQMFVWASMSDDFKRRYPHNETNAIETIFAIKIFAGPGELLETQTENIAWRINAYKELGFIDEN